MFSADLVPRSSPKRETLKSVFRGAIYLTMLAHVVFQFQPPRWLHLALTIPVFAIFIFLALALCWEIRMSEIPVRWPAYLFQTKLLMFPLTLLPSALPGFILACLHGVEYVAVVSSHVNYRDLLRDRRASMGIAAFFLFYIGITLLADLGKIAGPAGMWGLATLMSFAALHYSLDGMLFRSPGYYSPKTDS